MNSVSDSCYTIHDSEKGLYDCIADIENRLFSGQSLLTHPEDFNTEKIGDLIARISDPYHEITESEYRELVIKYAFLFIHPENLDALFSIGDISAFFHLAEIYFLSSRFPELSFIGEPIVLDVFQKIKPYGYAFSMVGDIPPTVEIVRSITERITEKNGDEEYRGVDMGTGSGILLLAQYIQGRRSGFTKFQNWGIEIDSQVADRASFIAKRLGFGSIIQGDTTKHEVFSLLQMSPELPPHFISNECIPNAGMNRDDDPFLYNLIALFSYFDTSSLRTKTSFFPHAIDIRNFKSDIIENQIENMGGFIDLVGRYVNTEEVSIYQSICLLKLSPNSDWQALSDIGKRVTGVVDLPHWRKRWGNRIRYNHIDPAQISQVSTRIVGVRHRKEVAEIIGGTLLLS